MGYKIQYGQTMVRIPTIDSQHKKKSIIPVKWVIMVCVAFLFVYLGFAGCLDFLIPGDKEVTTAAFSEMLENVRNGISVKTAFTDFCLEILDSAQINH